jgi:hypothetical protein
MTRFIFAVLSISYIILIFLLAGSSIDSYLSVFNPYSLLHIPLYGILTALLILSFVPISHSSNNPLTQSTNDSMTKLPNNLMPRFIIAGLIALGVAVADEVHQAYIPGREASFTDVLLDAIGIALVLLLFHRIFRWKKSSKPNHSLI